MLFHVRMDVRIPHDADAARIDQLKAVEKARCRALMQQGKWRHLWRLSGHYANISIVDVADTQELHDLISTLPLFPFMTITVEPMCRHTSSIFDSDR